MPSFPDCPDRSPTASPRCGSRPSATSRRSSSPTRTIPSCICGWAWSARPAGPSSAVGASGEARIGRPAQARALHDRRAGLATSAVGQIDVHRVDWDHARAEPGIWMAPAAPRAGTGRRGAAAGRAAGCSTVRPGAPGAAHRARQRGACSRPRARAGFTRGGPPARLPARARAPRRRDDALAAARRSAGRWREGLARDASRPGVRPPFEVYVNGVPPGARPRLPRRRPASCCSSASSSARSSACGPGCSASGGSGPTSATTWSTCATSSTAARGRPRAGDHPASPDHLAPHPWPQQLQRGQDRARGRGAVERVEVDAGRAAGQQLGALQRRVGDAELEHGVGVVGAPARAPRAAAAGMLGPHMPVIVLIWPRSVIGMMPGRIGTSMPAARASSTKREVELVVEEQLGDQERDAAVDLLLEEAQVVGEVGRLGVDLGEAGGADAEVVAARRSARPARSSSAGRPGCGRHSVSPRGGSPRRASTFSMPASAMPSRIVRSSSRRGADAGEVGHRLDPELLLDPLGHLERALQRVEPPAP